MGVELYTYFRSSAAYRVRIALNLKRLSYRPRFIHLAKGEQHSPDYREINPQKLVPSLVDRGTVLTQSLAIIEYLNDTYPEPPLLPRRRDERAYVRALAQIIACDIHPLNNLRVLQYLEHTMGQDEAARIAWIRHWIREGFEAFEAQVERHELSGRFCFGDTPTLADICVVPQVFSARRFGCDLSDFPRIRAIVENCQALVAFRDAAPEQQPDAE